MTQKPQFSGIVVAAGSSSRFGGAVRKQFRPLAGKTVLERSIAALAGRPAVGGVVVVLPPDEIGGPRAAVVGRLPGVLDLVAGGASRAESVRAGLAAAPATPFVLVHDAARPLASPDLVDAVIAATEKHGAALPGLPVPDTVKELEGGDRVARTLDRSSLRLAQTPQGARADWLREALERAAADGRQVTDESAALEHSGRPVAVVPGDPGNIKITSPDDIELAERLLAGSAIDLRVGSGFDAHARDEGRPLVLGGVLFEGQPGLAGHSDADVVLHAAMDALLGAAGLGDIGHLFPPEDPQYAGADSKVLARQVAALLDEQGFEPVNIDLTLLAEWPRIRDRSSEMRETIAACFGVAAGRVGLKATTLERLGALGRGEGIACQAVALIRRR
jgi:2-C-methyl-D-erythritol 4-phosphate cytidylyltransferase/2-C-methyl-D-erythritol 2,4-cyclodiphosphate synthase